MASTLCDLFKNEIIVRSTAILFSFFLTSSILMIYLQSTLVFISAVSTFYSECTLRTKTNF